MILFCSSFLHWSNTYRPTNKAFEGFWFCSWIRQLIQILTFGSDSVDSESHSLSTESTPSETPRQQSQRGVRPHFNWVNAEWWNPRKCWCLLLLLSWCGVSLRVDSVDMESHSALTQLIGNLTPRQLSVQKMNRAKTGIHNQLWHL